MIDGQRAYFLRALLVPWHPASLLFIVVCAALLAFFQGKGVYGIVGSYFLLSWLFKYAFVMLEHVANGRLDAPVVSAEMLGPFEQRPLILVGWCLVLIAVVRFLGGSAGVGLVAAILLLLPAVVSVLGLGLGVVQSLNPQQMWRIARGLGVYYLGILGLIGAAASLAAAMRGWGAWHLWSIALVQAAVLTVFSAIGGAIFEKRWDIGHEPLVSPERQMEQEDREHARALDAMLDNVYSQARLRRREAALEPLGQWLSLADERHIVADARKILGRVVEWNDREIAAPIGRMLLAELTRRGFPAAASEIRKFMQNVGA